MRGQKQLFASARTEESRDAGSTDSWGTPQALYDVLDAEFGFQLDPCASEFNAKAPMYYDEEMDGLAQSWGDYHCFVNFPYSNAKGWARKCIDAAREGAYVVVLCAARTDTAWRQSLAVFANEVRFIKGRLAFTRADGAKAESATFPSTVIVLLPELKQRSNLGHHAPIMTLWDLPQEVRR